MEITIKNNKDVKQKAVLFGYNQFAFNNYKKQDEISFLDINTDEGIEITINGDNTTEGKFKMLEQLSQRRFILESTEYTSNINITDNFHTFWVYMTDANGQSSFIPVHINNYIKSTQDTSYPIIISDAGIKGIDGNTALLFILRPHEEINLKLNEKK